MNWSRQALLGIGMFLGSGVLLYAMVQHMDAPKTQTALPPVPQMVESEPQVTDPLTADIETEARKLEEKRLQREAQAYELDAKSQAFLEEQRQAEQLALQKTQLENQQYIDNRASNNAIEPVMDEPAPDTPSSNFGESSSDNANNNDTAVETVVTQPVVTARTPPPEPQPNNDQRVAAASKPDPTQTNATANTQINVQTNTPVNTPPNNPLDYKVQAGDGLIKIAKRYNLPVEALARANNMNKLDDLQVGQDITIPATHQIPALLKAAQARPSVTSPQQQPKVTASVKSNQPAKKNVQEKNQASSNTAPARQLDYKVKRGDGLIKLARQYNVPVEALAQANNMSTTSNLRVGQTLTIPSRRQIARLKREAQEAKRAAEAAKTAQQRLREGRKLAAQGEVKGKFGVQVALADNQAKADEVAKKLKAAGYSVSTSRTSRGVRVIVGPETGKPAALALKDKINADSRVDVNGAWVLYWR